MIAATAAIAAGAILSMLADTMIPEAFEKVHNFTGLSMVAGFFNRIFINKTGKQRNPPSKK